MIPIPNRLTLKLIAGIGCVLLLALLVHDRNRWKARTAHYAEMLAAERGAHLATVAGYRAAAERARLQDAANAARVKTAQVAINQRSEHELQSRLAAARAAAERLHGKQAAPTDSRRGGSQAVSGLPAAAAGPHQAAGQDGLSDADQRAAWDRGALGPADALTATEQAIQLDELIRWVRSQAGVEVSRD